MKKQYLLFLIVALIIGKIEAQEKLIPTGQSPILAWYRIPFGETTVKRYKEMREAGFTHSSSFFPNLDALHKALEVAQKTGVKLMVSCPELKTDPEKTVQIDLLSPAK
jgi:hypothetical protein